jgi:hypothetical protein
MIASGFQDVASHDFKEPRVWNADQLVGYLHSVSTLSILALGSRVDEFDADIRQTLKETDRSGRYSETATFGYLSGAR